MRKQVIGAAKFMLGLATPRMGGEGARAPACDRTFISDYADRQCYYSKKEIAGRLLTRVGIGAVVSASAAEREAGPCLG